MKIINLKEDHENISITDDKEFTCAFIMVYRAMNIMMSNSIYKQEISESLIIDAICNVYLELSTQSERIHFLLSLVYGSLVKINNENVTIISKESMYRFKSLDLIKLASKCVNNVRNKDEFLMFIKDCKVNRYDNIEDVIKTIYLSKEKEFSKILLELGYKKDIKI